MKMTEAVLLDKVLTVDPGMTTAWAYWEKKRFPYQPLVDSFNTETGAPIEEQAEELWRSFQTLIYHHIPEKCYIEGVEVWTKSLRSNVASKTGKLFKLAFIIGGYCRLCQERGIEFQIINPSKWKGQLNDKAIKRRVLRVNKNQYRNQHITDAVAMGFSIMGIL